VNKQPLLLSFVTALLVAVIHIFGLELSLYWLWRPLDSMMHFLAGVSIGLFVAWFMVRLSLLRPALYWGAVILATLVVGLAWEWFERQAGISVFHGQLYWPDTISDLALDLAGAIIAAYPWKNR
jgi:hypothetical protein